MSDSMFDPTQFLDASTDQPSTRRPPLPAGRVLVGVIGEIKMSEWTKKDDPSKNGVKADVPIEFDLTAYPDLIAQQGGSVTKVILSDSIMLDLTPDKKIDWSPGKNNKIRRYREALDMNKPGDVWSFRAMIGRPIAAKIGHRTWQNELFDQIEDVARPQ